MKRQWTAEELSEHWTLAPSELALLANKTGATRLSFALALKCCTRSRPLCWVSGR
jgi:hypothetical protein